MTMPTRTPILKVHTTGKQGRVTYKLTQTQVRALATVGQDDQLSEVTPFATARALTRLGLLRQAGPTWFITRLGKQVRNLARLKQEGTS